MTLRWPIRHRGDMLAPPRGSAPKPRFVMRLLSVILAAVVGCGATMTHAAGLKFIDIPADDQGPALTGAAWYPCAAPATEVKLRSIVVPALRDCPVAGEKLPLIIISHGTVGWFGGHHDTAATLADAGFIVA